MLELQHIVKSFGRKQVLKGADAQFPSGSISGIVGENGSGKSTLLKLMVGLIKPDEGIISYKGSVGYCPQEQLVFPNLTVKEHLRLFAVSYGNLGSEKWRTELLERFNLNGCFEQRVAHLSGGTRQKLNLVLALLHNPDVLFLDEPYAAFDWDTYRRFWDLVSLLKAAQKQVIIVSHLIHDQAQMDQVYELKEGRLSC